MNQRCNGHDDPKLVLSTCCRVVDEEPIIRVPVPLDHELCLKLLDGRDGNFEASYDPCDEKVRLRG